MPSLARSDDDRIAYLAGDSVDSLSPQERAHLDELRELLRAPASWGGAQPWGHEDRIVDAIAKEAGARRAPGGTPAARSRSQRPPMRLRLGLDRPAYAFGGLATAATAVAVAVVIARSGRSAPAPLQFAMAGSGAQLAPGADGSASLTKTGSGWGIELWANGLPHLENGRYYQAWLKNAAGILVSVGTFNDAKHVTLWSGVPVTQFRTLTVTVQPADGNPISSCRPVL